MATPVWFLLANASGLMATRLGVLPGLRWGFFHVGCRMMEHCAKPETPEEDPLRQDAEVRDSDIIPRTKAFLDAQFRGLVTSFVLRQTWEQFYRLYTQVIRNFALACGVPQSDLDDCEPDEWLALFQQLPTFQYNRRLDAATRSANKPKALSLPLQYRDNGACVPSWLTRHACSQQLRHRGCSQRISRCRWRHHQRASFNPKRCPGRWFEVVGPWIQRNRSSGKRCVRK